MDDSIFSGKFSLTDDIPEQPASFARTSSEYLDRFQAYGDRPSGIDRTEQPEPLPEPMLSPAARRVREEARRLGIDYDAEVAKIITRMGGYGLGGALPNPGNKRAGPDPYKNVKPEHRLQAEYAATEILRRKWESPTQLSKSVQDLWSKEVLFQAAPTLKF